MGFLDAHHRDSNRRKLSASTEVQDSPEMSSLQTPEENAQLLLLLVSAETTCLRQ